MNENPAYRFISAASTEPDISRLRPPDRARSWDRVPKRELSLNDRSANDTGLGGSYYDDVNAWSFDVQRINRDGSASSTQMQSLWLPAIRAQVTLNRKNSREALTDLQSVAPPIEFGSNSFVINVSCLYPTYIRGEAYLPARQGAQAAAEFQKILDHNGTVWNCWTGALAHLGVARANALQPKASQGHDADAARVRALAAYQDSSPSGKTPILTFPF